MSICSQTNRLGQILIKNNILVNEKIVSTKSKLSQKDEADLGSILDYLYVKKKDTKLNI